MRLLTGLRITVNLIAAKRLQNCPDNAAVFVSGLVDGIPSSSSFRSAFGFRDFIRQVVDMRIRMVKMVRRQEKLSNRNSHLGREKRQ